jgi:hypothetical protein
MQDTQDYVDTAADEVDDIDLDNSGGEGDVVVIDTEGLTVAERATIAVELYSVQMASYVELMSTAITGVLDGDEACQRSANLYTERQPKICTSYDKKCMSWNFWGNKCKSAIDVCIHWDIQSGVPAQAEIVFLECMNRRLDLMSAIDLRRPNLETMLISSVFTSESDDEGRLVNTGENLARAARQSVLLTSSNNSSSDGSDEPSSVVVDQEVADYILSDPSLEYMIDSQNDLLSAAISQTETSTSSYNAVAATTVDLGVGVNLIFEKVEDNWMIPGYNSLTGFTPVVYSNIQLDMRGTPSLNSAYGSRAHANWAAKSAAIGGASSNTGDGSNFMMASMRLDLLNSRNVTDLTRRDLFDYSVVGALVRELSPDGTRFTVKDLSDAVVKQSGQTLDPDKHQAVFVMSEEDSPIVQSKTSFSGRYTYKRGAQASAITSWGMLSGGNFQSNRLRLRGFSFGKAAGIDLSRFVFADTLDKAIDAAKHTWKFTSGSEREVAVMHPGVVVKKLSFNSQDRDLISDYS